MTFRDRIGPFNRWIEPLLALAVTGAFSWALIHLYLYNYLTQPYFFVPEDSYMDWVNTAHYAHNPGAYDSWGTIYPPLSFVVLKFLTNGTCYTTAEWYSSRSCDWYGLLMLHTIYFVNIVLIAKTFIKCDRSTVLPRTIALSIGYPMTFALERGNILLLCFTCILLAYGPLVRSTRLRWLAAAFAVNFKVYLVGTLFAQLLRRRWRWFEGALVTSVIVYLISFALLGGHGTPKEIYDNIVLFGELTAAGNPLDLWNPVTYNPAILLLKSPFPVPNVIGSRATDILTIVLPLAIHVTQATILLAAAAAWLRPEAITTQRVVFLALAITLVSSEAGSYTQIFLILFVFMEKWQGFARKWAIVGCYILCIPHDFISISNMPAVATAGFLGKQEIIADYSIGIMPLVRPGIVLSIAIAMSCATIHDVWAYIRQNGWRERWRYRHAHSSAADDSRAAPTAA